VFGVTFKQQTLRARYFLEHGFLTAAEHKTAASDGCLVVRMPSRVAKLLVWFDKDVRPLLVKTGTCKTFLAGADGCKCEDSVFPMRNDGVQRLFRDGLKVNATAKDFRGLLENHAVCHAHAHTQATPFAPPYHSTCLSSSPGNQPAQRRIEQEQGKPQAAVRGLGSEALPQPAPQHEQRPNGGALHRFRDSTQHHTSHGTPMLAYHGQIRVRRRQPTSPGSILTSILRC
jgi:hypothetical protein